MAAPKRRLDVSTFAGIGIALAGIIGGLILERGTLQDLGQFTALLIVVGGTAGALMISVPSSNLRRALQRSRVIFFADESDDLALVETILRFGTQARRRGIGLMEPEALAIREPFLRKGLLLAVDGVETNEIRRHMELELRRDEERVDSDARVFEVAGGYAPTVGILGAVLGLIQVMKHLSSLGDVGRGIAVAFVATLYGVGSANLLLLPAAAKIRRRGRMEAQRHELMLEGVLGIAEGRNPHLIRLKLESCLDVETASAVSTPSVPARAVASDTI